MPANLSSCGRAKWLDRAIWSEASRLTAKWLAALNTSQALERLSRLQRISGGSSDTELKLLAVTPTLWPSVPQAVTMVTPLAKLPRARRNWRGSMLFSAVVMRLSWDPSVALPARDPFCCRGESILANPAGGFIGVKPKAPFAWFGWLNGPRLVA
ncbi:hypothetical protein D9M71_636870 [compost metagenome]